MILEKQYECFYKKHLHFCFNQLLTYLVEATLNSQYRLPTQCEQQLKQTKVRNMKNITKHREESSSLHF